MKRTLLIALLSMFCAVTVNAQSILYVKNSAESSAWSWVNAITYTDLQTAIYAAQPGDQIWVAEGIYYPSESVGGSTDVRSRSFIMHDSISIYGGFAGTEHTLGERSHHSDSWHFLHPTVLSGDIGNTPDNPVDNAYHVVYCNENSGVTIDGLTIENGYANGMTTMDQQAGGAVLDAGCRLENCIIRNNSAATRGGGAVLVTGSRVVNCLFENNGCVYAGSKGGALYITSNSSVMEDKVIGCRFENNHAKDGGAIYCNANSLRFINSTFIANRSVQGTSWNNGGAAYVGAASEFNNCIFMMNKGVKGGAIYSVSANLHLSNCLITNNSATQQGGAVYATGSSSYAVNTTFANNIAATDNAIYGGTNFTLFNSILWNNGDTDSQLTSGIRCMYSGSAGTVLSGTGNVLMQDSLEFVHPCHEIGLPENNADSTMILSADYSLLATSICRDAGSLATLTLSGYTFPETDLAGNPRVDGIIDIGAYELQCNLDTPELQYVVLDTLDTVTVIVQVTITNRNENHHYSYTLNDEDIFHEITDSIFTFHLHAPSENTVSVRFVNELSGCIGTTELTVILDSLHFDAPDKIADFRKIDLNVYPNPASDFLMIQTTDTRANGSVIVICDMAGKPVMIQELDCDNYLNISNLPSGMYFLEVKNSKEVLAGIKFIKK